MRQQSPSSIPNILKEIQGGKIYPVYLLCGEEEFLIENALKQMLDTLLEPNTRDFNLDLFDGVTVSVRDILTAVEVYPVMSEWRVVVVREPTFFKSKKGPSPVELIQTAADAVNENPQKAISVMVKVLGISAQEIVDQSNDFTSTLNEVIEAHGDSLTSEDMAFLQNLPQTAAELDNLPGASGSSDDTELLIEWLQGTLPEQGVLVLTVKGNVDARSRLVKAIDRVGRYVSFAQLEAARSLREDVLFQGLSRRLEEYNKKITPGAFNLLRKRTGNDMHVIFEELQKLVAFIGDKPQIDEKDVHDLVVQSTFDNIFALTDAIGKRSVDQALASLHSVLGSGEPPIKVNALIVRQIRLTLQAKLLVEKGALKPNAGQTNYRNFADKVFTPLASQVSSLLPKSASINLLKQNPFAAYKIIQSVPNFSTDELIQFLEKTLDADIQLKSSSLDAGIILEQLVYELCTRPKSRRGQDRWGNVPVNVGLPMRGNA
jgi:DNA polymerase III subunit delta